MITSSKFARDVSTVQYITINVITRTLCKHSGVIKYVHYYMYGNHNLFSKGLLTKADLVN